MTLDLADVGALRRAKQVQRGRARALRDALAAQARERASTAILTTLTELPQWRSAGRVLAYSSIGSEVATHALFARVLREGKTLVLPRIDKAQRRLELFQVNAIEADTELGVWGIREPRSSCMRVDDHAVDLAIVPALLFDADGFRMGYGGGYYDELLPRLGTHCWRVGVAFAVQVVTDLVHDAHDQRVDLVLTESALYRIRGAA